MKKLNAGPEGFQSSAAILGPAGWAKLGGVSLFAVLGIGILVGKNL